MRILLFLLILGVMFAGCLQSQSSLGSSQLEFTCENNNSAVNSRGYVLLMGLADHTKEGWVLEKSYMEQDPKAEFVVIYDQDETKHLPEVSAKFLADMHMLLQQRPVDELVIFGASAGGVTSSYSISKLNFSGPVALHTLSSPLKGYGFSGVKENLLGDRAGYLRDIAIGFDKFDTPGPNVKVYHHKTVRDTVLVDHYCKGVEVLCNAVEIQNNNIEGSTEFFHPEYDHNQLMPPVIKKVLKCYNPDLVLAADENVTLGEMCRGEAACNIFCQSNMGRCNEYCQQNPSNSICQKLFDFQVTR